MVRAPKDGPKRTERRTLSFSARRFIRGKVRGQTCRCDFVIVHEAKNGGGGGGDEPPGGGRVETPGGSGAFRCTPRATLLANEGQFRPDPINRYRVLIRCNQRIRTSTVDTKNLLTGAASVAPCSGRQDRSGRSLSCVSNTAGKQISFEFAIIQHDPPEFSIQAFASGTGKRFRAVIRPAPVTTS